MKKALVRRVVSLFLCFCMVIGFVPIIDAQAAEIKGGTFDPHTGYLELEFGYQLTQYVNINVYVRSPSDDGLKKEFIGSIVENYLLSGANDVKAWLPEDSPDTMVSPYTPATKTDGGLVKLSEDGIYQADKNFAGEDIEPVAMMKHTLIWDGSLNGIPIIGPNLDEDVFYLTVEIKRSADRIRMLSVPTVMIATRTVRTILGRRSRRTARKSLLSVPNCW